MPARPDGAGDGALTRCISCAVGDFADRHWGRAPLLSRAADLPAGGFTGLLDAAGVDELMSARALRTPFLRMAKDGDVLAATTFTRAGGAGATIADQVADDKVLGRLADGATLVLQALHRSWPPLVTFASTLSAELGHPVQVNAYITPPQNQGFAAHYDVHDVFVLQVSGHKHWTIHEPIVVDPLANQPWDKRRDAVSSRAGEDPVIDTVLAPGDALYLPRGTIHSARALGETSIHLTVGVHPLTRHHVVKHLLELAQEDTALRASLPMGVDLADPAVLADELDETVRRLTDWLRSADAAAVARRIGTDLMTRTRPEPVGPLTQLAAADAVAGDSRLRLRSALRTRLETVDDRIRLAFLDRWVEFPVAMTDAVKAVLAGDEFGVAHLPGLDADDQLVLCRRLLREGVVVTVAPR